MTTGGRTPAEFVSTNAWWTGELVRRRRRRRLTRAVASIALVAFIAGCLIAIFLMAARVTSII